MRVTNGGINGVKTMCYSPRVRELPLSLTCVSLMTCFGRNSLEFMLIFQVCVTLCTLPTQAYYRAQMKSGAPKCSFSTVLGWVWEKTPAILVGLAGGDVRNVAGVVGFDQHGFIFAFVLFLDRISVLAQGNLRLTEILLPQLSQVLRL